MVSSYGSVSSHCKAMDRAPKGEHSLAVFERDHLADIYLKSGLGWASLPFSCFVPFCLTVLR